MGETFWRLQPVGAPVVGHTSTASNDELLDAGYVFAYTQPEGIVDGIAEWGGLMGEPAASFEVVEFEGEDAYDPGDAEGVAVLAVREIARMALVEWLTQRGELERVEDWLGI